MNKFRRFAKSHSLLATFLSVGASCHLLRSRTCPGESNGTTVSKSDSALIADYRRVEVASVSDALEQLTGRRMYVITACIPSSPPSLPLCADGPV